MKQSKELRNFYRKVYKWLKKGAKHRQPFCRDDGLCGMLAGTIDGFYQRQEMLRQFRLSGLDTNYPFGRSSYVNRSNSYTQHKDKNRVRWVKKHLNIKVKKKFKLK